eukprot:7362040-Alexandrium_andersonii.AAC.3
MARHDGFQPPGDLLGAAPEPSTHHDRGDGNRPEARHEGHLVIRVLGQMDLLPAPQSRWPSCLLTRRKEFEKLFYGVLWQACDLLRAPRVWARCLATALAKGAAETRGGRRAGTPVRLAVGGPELFSDALNFWCQG